MTSALPARLTDVIGRRRDRDEVIGLLEGARCLTLTGSGGCGKTTLALEVATAWARGRSERAIWVDLAATDDPAQVAPRLAGALGIRERSGEDLGDRLAHELAGRSMLIVIDNCEHLLAACAELLTRLLRSSTRTRVLATSREPLLAPGEVTYRVPSLDVPDEAATEPTEVAAAEAVQLFLARGSAARPDFALSEANATAVADICRRLDGIPLAIELAAARLRLLGPRQIADGLEDRFRLLTSGARTARPRQQTLEASVEWSYDLLSDEQRLVLARLSVFAGTFDLAAAEAVAAGGPVAAPEVLEHLGALVDRSLVQVEHRETANRYRLLETIRAYARDRLAELDQPTRVRDRHLEHLSGVAASARAGLAGPDLDRWLTHLDAELDDLRAAMDWATTSGRPERVLEIANATLNHWLVRGRYLEMHRRLQDAMATGSIPDAALASGLARASIMALMGGDFSGGHAFADRAVGVARRGGELAGLAEGLTFRAWCGFFAGATESTTARRDFDEALEVARPLDDHELWDRAETYRALIDMFSRSLPDGRAELEAIADRIQARGYRYMLLPARAFLGSGVALFEGRLARAERHAEDAIAIGSAVGVKAFTSLAIGGLGTICALRGERDRAVGLMEESSAVARSGGLRTFDMIAARWAGVVHHRFDDHGAAVRASEAGFEAAIEAGSRWDEAATRWLLGVLALRADDAPAAVEHLDGARRVAEGTPYPFALGRAVLGQAHLELRHGEVARAWDLAHDSLEILDSYGDRAGAVDALDVLAAIGTQVDRADQAARILAAGDRWRSDHGIGRFPLEADAVAATRTHLERALGTQQLSRLATEGATISLDEAVAHARRGRGDRGRPVQGWDSLTPAEARVASLVARGCTNGEVAERLFVSVNTVKTQLGHVYAKLGVANRTELAAAAAARAAPDHPGG
jgi:predicted ATPase/DNA-binding CsgD family transcriptional regulator